MNALTSPPLNKRTAGNSLLPKERPEELSISPPVFRPPLELFQEIERELLKCLAKGFSLEETAKVIGIAYRTTQGRAQKLRKKLRVETNAELAELAKKIIPQDECVFCGRRFQANELRSTLLIPKSRGGGECIQNSIVACVYCLYSRGEQTPHEWAERILAAR